MVAEHGKLGDDLRGINELTPMRIEDFRRERVTVTRFSTIRAATAPEPIEVPPTTIAIA